MSEHSIPNQGQKLLEGLRPFSELLSQENIVYHGVGADIIAVTGIAQEGLLSALAQEEKLGIANTNSPPELAKNGETHISVARAPQPGSPNQAFMTYIEHSPISFAIDASKAPLTQPPGRGFYDEGFIEGATSDDIVGVVIDAETADRPIAELPIVTANISADVVAGKSRAYLELMEHVDPAVGLSRGELEGLLDGISHIDIDYIHKTWGQVSKEDEKKIEAIDTWLRDKLTAVLVTRFGSADMSVLEMVRLKFPDKDIYVNDHTSGTELYNEQEYFATLPSDAKIGYQKFDGKPGSPSLEMLRRASPQR
ncbi:MAG: hypothetical protein WCO19_01235 [Candidatus Saccharibacteria bacterium]